MTNIKSAVSGSKRELDVAKAWGTKDKATINVTDLREDTRNNIVVKATDVLAALQAHFPELKVTYEVPIVIPTALGSLLRQTGEVSALNRYIVKYGDNKWRFHSAHMDWSDEDVRDGLRTGRLEFIKEEK